MVTDIINAIVDTVTGLLEGLGVGLQSFFSDAFMVEGESPTLSALGTFVFVLVGISIGLAAVRWVLSLVRRQN